MDALQTAVDIVGGQTALAAVLGVKQQNVWNWLSRAAFVPPVHCPAIEPATGYVVMRWHLRPHDWWRIWPELIGAPGAPETARKLRTSRVKGDKA
jgi:DNA-binding transcriptional regulator YdaS (Cro superfamily)